MRSMSGMLLGKDSGLAMRSFTETAIEMKLQVIDWPASIRFSGQKNVTWHKLSTEELQAITKPLETYLCNVIQNTATVSDHQEVKHFKLERWSEADWNKHPWEINKVAVVKDVNGDTVLTVEEVLEVTAAQGKKTGRKSKPNRGI
ncbi:hypothetical protein E1B28_006801 [Marasmius oreades]|uniref:Uncharacterized protein n=1 Tax=Marasmius oreades TaxID=181124 RepID=A0A9P7UWW0_9AGAR|nr:uncharacterized protein E1B28_006801 [Marasmius oreades]KAG7096127.1 hypothetical protein E1B28_006801 [Marasmius oreades]